VPIELKKEFVLIAQRACCDSDNEIAYAFRGRDAPAQDSTLDGSSLSDHAAVLCVADLRDPAAGMALPRRGDGQSRPAPGTARYPFLVV
jgi:hypothetical protein